jgi:hypothetical protein
MAVATLRPPAGMHPRAVPTRSTPEQQLLPVVLELPQEIQHQLAAWGARKQHGRPTCQAYPHPAIPARLPVAAG